MKIAIIGTGSVGSALGRGLREGGARGGVRRAGHGQAGGRSSSSRRREPAPPRSPSGGRRGGGGAGHALGRRPRTSSRPPEGSAGKIVFDCINPLNATFSGLDTGGARSAAEQIAAWAPGARVVKVFNSTGAGNMADPRYGDDRATMLYCGDDEGAKEVAARLAADLGFEPVDAGPLSAAYLLEHFAMLWIHLAYGAGMGTEHRVQADAAVSR